MNLTPLQERRLRQTEDQIVFLKKQVQTRGAWYVIRSALFYVVLFYTIDFLTGIFIDKKLLMQYFADVSWLKFLFNWIVWIGIQYLVLIKDNNDQLKHKRRELQELRKRYALTEDAQ